MALIQSQNTSDEPFLPSLDETEKGSRKKLGCFFVSLSKWVLKVTMWVVFIAWIALFFLIPSDYGTNLYDDLVTATSGNLFGETGVALLLYGGPLFIIAFLAVPYLIISDEEQVHEHKAPRFRLWTFPVLVDGPFGVVSAAELIGILLFVVFVLWAVSAYAVTNFEMLPTYGDLTLNQKRVQMLQMSAYCFAFIALSCLAFLFLPITRGSILLRLVNIPFEHATKYHIWLGNLIMFLLTLHGLGYMTVWIIRGILLSSIVEWKSDGGANFAGVICYGFGLVIWISALGPVRRRYFDIFYYTHHLYIFFVIFLALHVGDTYFSKAAGGIFLFLLDRFLRFWQSRRTVKITSATCFPCGSVKLVFSKPKNLRYNALSFIFLKVGEVSWLQWHPFSVSSSPLDGKYHISILLKCVGDWTSKLRGKLSNCSVNQSELDLHANLTASIEGPYGHESPYYLKYSKLILVAGGSGISPFLAILSDILNRIKYEKPCFTRNVLLVWAVRNSGEVSLLSTVDMESICPSYSDKLTIEIEIYATRESEPLLEEGKAERGVLRCGGSVGWIQGGQGGAMSLLCGTGSKVWCGVYVIISSIGFVVIWGLLEKYYMVPLDVSYWWYRGILFLGSMVAAVVMVGGGVVALWHIWERKWVEAAEEDGERLDNETVTRGSQESVGVGSGIKIRYGRRPDFGEIFEENGISDGSDVGVIVCGPSNLQSSVARECRSRNLRRSCSSSSSQPVFHFHSHSFCF
ncbi:hypothetical protein SLA2020_474020 [Shorea laevis]